MKTNQGTIVLAERAADYGRLRSVLLEWGYEETEIQRVLKEPRVDQKLETRGNTTDDRSGKSRIAGLDGILCIRGQKDIAAQHLVSP